MSAATRRNISTLKNTMHLWSGSKRHTNTEVLADQGVQVIATYPNNDAGGREIINKLDEINARSISGIQVHRSLGRYLYHGVLSHARDSKNRIACVGNSSSGIKETPVFGCPTVNIGSRQLGRLRGQNVLDVSYSKQLIVDAVQSCFNDEKFRQRCRETDNPYYLGDAGKKIADILASTSIDERLIRKQMVLRGRAKDGWYQ